MARDLVYEPEGTVKSTALQRMPQGGNVVPFPEGSGEPIALRDSTFLKMGTKRVTKKQQAVLMKPASPKTEIEILPTGEIYPPQIAMRKRLAAAFGPMGWALRPIMPPTPPDDKSVMYREYVLIADGRVVANAIGSQKYYAQSKRMDYGDVLEAIKSDALKRCCKDIGVLWECWDPSFAADWQKRFAVHVYVRVRDDKDRTKLTQKAMWRRIDRKPLAWKLADEIEPVADSPNIDAWIKERQAWTALIDRDTERIKAVNAEYRAARGRNLEARKESESLGINPDATLPVIDVQPLDARAHMGDGDSAFKEATGEYPDRKPEGNQRGSRPAVTHAPHAVNTDDKPFLIKECKVMQRTPKFTLHKIVMMNGDEYRTFSTTVYADMQKHFAARDKVLIQYETKRVNGQPVKEILEYQVKSRGKAAIE